MPAKMILKTAALAVAALGFSVSASAMCASTYCSASSASSYVAPQLQSSVSLAETGYYAGSAADVPAGMCPVSCDVNVDAPAGSKVLGCYAPCAQPAPQPTVSYVDVPVTTAYRVVRPIINVPVPVPTPIRVIAPTPCVQPALPVMPLYSRCGR